MTVLFDPGPTILARMIVHFDSRVQTIYLRGTVHFGPFEPATLDRTLQIFPKSKMIRNQNVIWCPNALHNFENSKDISRKKFTNVGNVTYHQGKLYDTISVQVGINPSMNPGKKSKTRDRHRACFPKKNQCVALHHFVYVPVLWSFPGKQAHWRSQKMAYIFVQQGIFPLILAYAIWNLHHSKAQLTVYQHI